jgi:hypothetical protein
LPKDPEDPEIGKQGSKEARKCEEKGRRRILRKGLLLS